jgi:hypothetical protein
MATGRKPTAATVRRLLKSGTVVVRVDASAEGVVLPGYLMRRGVACISFAADNPANLRITKTGIAGTMTFSKRAPWSRRLGRRRILNVPCVIPWASVTAVERMVVPEPAPDPVEPWRPPPARDFAGKWHWDDARASVDAVIACLPDDDSIAGVFSRRLDKHDTDSRADSTLVYRWGVELGKLWELPDPCAYASALTNSSAIHRPSLATREDCAAGVVHHVSERVRLELEGMAELARIRRGLPLADGW